MNSVTTAQMAIYAIMIIPVLYLLVKHGRPGIMGWLYFAAFCMLRILGGALALSGSESATIIGNIGLSPLLLAACGILHESNRLRRSENPKLEWPLVMTFHLLIAGATAILAVGASALQDSSPTPSDLKKVQVGIAILAAGWAILLGWTAQSWFRPGNTQNMEASRAGKQLLIAVFAVLIFIGVRVFYTLVAFVSRKASLSPTTGTVAVRVVLILLPELIAALIFLSYGWITRNARASEKTSDSKNGIRLTSEDRV